MKEEAGMIRIAIGTLALTMIAVPVIAGGAAAPPAQQPPPAEAAAMTLSQDEVLALARHQGVARLSDISFENNVWVVTGESRGGFPMALHISSTGEILTHTS